MSDAVSPCFPVDRGVIANTQFSRSSLRGGSLAASLLL
jgi:hypothetical protein